MRIPRPAVAATLALLRAALDDSRRFDKFVLCSGACVPLKPFEHVHSVLTSLEYVWPKMGPNWNFGACLTISLS